MSAPSRFEAVLWIIIPLLVLPILGVLPVPVDVIRAFRDARSELEEENLGVAADRLGYLAARLPWRSGLWEPAALTALQAGDPRTANRYFRQAQTAGRLTLDGAIAYGDTYWEIGQKRRALAVWESVAAQIGDNVAVFERLYQAYREQEDYSRAVDALRQIARLDPQNAAVQYDLGVLLAAQEPQAALAHLLQAVELDASLAETVSALEDKLVISVNGADAAYVFLNAGRALGFVGEWNLAVEAFERAVQENSAYAEAWAFLGEAQAQTGADGRDALETAFGLNPESLTVNTLFALYWKRAQQYDRALVYAEVALGLDPENPALNAEIASVYDGLGDVNAALEYYYRATQLDPQRASYWHLLARYALNNEIQIREIGISAAQQALLLDENDPIALDLLGYAHYLLNDFSTAERYLQRAIVIQPDYASAHFHLALVYLLDGKPDLAYESLQTVLTLAPESSPIATQAQRALSRYFP